MKTPDRWEGVDRRPPALEAKGLAYRYPDGRQALFGVDLSLAQGERVALLGPNGAGKTTFVLHLNGILATQAGSITIAGQHVTPPRLHDIRRRVGLVFQDPDDQLFMPTVWQDVAFGPANYGLAGEALDARVKEALACVGMSGAVDRLPHHLSGGQRRRVALATVLAMQPDILVLDEPTANLDPAARRDLAQVLERLDITMLMVTHDLSFAAQMCERTAILADGSIVADGPTFDVLSNQELLSTHRLELPFGFDLGRAGEMRYGRIQAIGPDMR